MSASPEPDPVDALNQVLNEVLEVVQDVKQAHRKVPEPGTLHTELDRLFEDLREWAQALVAQDESLGVSPLSRVPSADGRLPANLWPGVPSEGEVRTALSGHLERLDERVGVALSHAPDESARTTLATIQAALISHLQALRP